MTERGWKGDRLAQAGPVEDDFAGFAGDHGGETIFELPVRVAVGDYGGDVEARVEHYRHLVPGLVHFPAVDALDRDHVEDHGAPVHGNAPGRDAECGDLATVAHVGDHVAQSLRVAGHLQAHVESFGHLELLLHFTERSFHGINGKSGTHLA